MNYYDSDLEAEALKLYCYMPQTFIADTTNPSPMFYGFYAFKWQLTQKNRLANKKQSSGYVL